MIEYTYIIYKTSASTLMQSNILTNYNIISTFQIKYFAYDKTHLSTVNDNDWWYNIAPLSN